MCQHQTKREWMTWLFWSFQDNDCWNIQIKWNYAHWNSECLRWSCRRRWANDKVSHHKGGNCVDFSTLVIGHVQFCHFCVYNLVLFWVRWHSWSTNGVEYLGLTLCIHCGFYMRGVNFRTVFMCWVYCAASMWDQQFPDSESALCPPETGQAIAETGGLLILSDPPSRPLRVFYCCSRSLASFTYSFPTY